MGISGLMSKCLDNKDKCADLVDLVQVAQERDGIEILVDLYCMQYFLLSQFYKSQMAVLKNPFLKILGGEYNALDQYITKFIKDLQSLKINLVFFIDGCRGSSRTVLEQKRKMERHESGVKNVHAILDVCSGLKRTEQLECKSFPNLCQVCRTIQFTETLRRWNFEIVSLSCGEADRVLVSSLLERPRAYAIWSSDADFCIFKGSCFIPKELFDTTNELGLAKSQPLPNTPRSLICGVISSSKVSSMLQV